MYWDRTHVLTFVDAGERSALIQADCVSHLLLDEALLLLLLLLVDGGRVRRRECRCGHILSWRGHHVSGLMRRGRRRCLE